MFIIVKLCRNVEHIVDHDVLCEMYNDGGRLEGAHVFARLFGIIQDDLFQAPDSSIVDLTPYDIYESEWVMLYGFIRNGFILNTRPNKINICYDVSIKLGGIPSFEKYLQTEHLPMTPLEDIRQKYQWKIINISGSSIIFKNETVTTPFENDPEYVYLRCEKEFHSKLSTE